MNRTLLLATFASVPLTSAAQPVALPESAQRTHVALADTTLGLLAAHHVVEFWSEAGPQLWFAKSPEFDKVFRAHFAAEHEAAARGELENWLDTAEGALALLILLDQYPRNAFRGSPRMYATDAEALRYANLAIAFGHDRGVAAELQMFFYLPFAHSERLDDQERSVALCTRLDRATLARAEHHRDIVKRFGRFPHRNAILGRSTTPQEQAYLDAGGFTG
jgi:uncharacterized protein (DUF924 family)